jgi:hypothetical protein
MNTTVAGILVVSVRWQSVMNALYLQIYFITESNVELVFEFEGLEMTTFTVSFSTVMCSWE